ncbi:hypothetical protein HZS55_15525 [Halosimplex rubrum]|uniref:Uncharacterized protein n=1 Tax=Halosimplex rubrum TaxID=869889 RepID=A0A7D5TMX9_9EURY|nr:hypothetical protein [Halosimplex rubrum]QLH78612.1 hypothetical protein HZS55_15525 [Halosimplex rubrum]
MVDTEPFGEYCEFGGDRVYLLVALARAKENEGTTSNTAPAIRKVVEDESDLDRKAAELDHAASRFDERFRLYLTANARDALKATFELRRSMDDWLEGRIHGDEGVRAKFKRVDGEFVSTLQSDACRDETNFVFDLDDATAADRDALVDDLRDHTEVALTRETPNGYHVVTDPFNYNKLATGVEYELKTDGMVFVSYLDG